MISKYKESMENRPTALVRLFATDGTLLYSALATNLGRVAPHARKADWWPLVARREYEWYPTRSAAVAAEKLLGDRGIGAGPARRQYEKRFPHEPRCNHRFYHMTCRDYEDLLARAGGYRCEICHSGPFVRMTGLAGEIVYHPVPFSGLAIDHDHALGHWAVRGLLCFGCNRRMAEVDAGRRVPDVPIRHYLDSSWHLQHRAGSTGCPIDCMRTTHQR